MLHIVTVATDSKYYLPHLEKTCKDIGGVELTVIGLGEKWGGYIWKFQKMLDFLRKVPREDVVCFVDGYDVICNRDLSDIIPKFLKVRNRKKCKMIIAKDHCVFPLDVILHVYFGKCDGTRVNSGTYLGYAGDVLDIESSDCKAFDLECLLGGTLVLSEIKFK
jgi:hypothetical protein